MELFFWNDKQGLVEQHDCLVEVMQGDVVVFAAVDLINMRKSM